MFDIVKEYNSMLVRIDQILSMKGSDFYMKICVDTEVVKNQKKVDFKAYIFNVVNPKIRGYLTNVTLPVDTKYESINFIMMSAILEYFHHPDFGFDDEDISLISKNLNQSDALEVLGEHFKNKYGEDKLDKYLENAKACFSPMEFALSVYSNYESAKGKGIITNEHINTFKMIMGKEFMETAYGEEKEGKNSQNSANPTSKSSTGGCYIATCVYHSYDCPEVWCLRRYRDNYLSSHSFGRAFIKVYYFVSPKVVKLFGKTKWFNNLFKPFLDKKVEKLKQKGYSCLPYKD